MSFRPFLALGLSFAAALDAAAVFSELMYHPSQGRDYEYIELATTGEAVNLSGWSLGGGVLYTFAAGAEIPAGGRIVACASRAAFLRAYPDADPARVHGDWRGSLADGGDGVVLANGFGAVVETVLYDDDAPWDFLADGFGPSLERVCLTAGALLPENWRASPMAPPEAFGGTPLAPCAAAACPPVAPARPPVRISEVMYHPVLEQDYEDRHEFIEIVNTGTAPVDLTGWRFAGGIDYEIPSATIEPGRYLVVAFDKDALLGVARYALAPEQIVGSYGERGRSLDNGGEKIALMTAEGTGVDSMSYDDDFPWPVGADALGAGEEWLPWDWLPLESHRHMGRSLERVSLDGDSNSVANWLASPIDGATPGKANSVARDSPRPVVAAIRLRPSAPRPNDPLIRKDDSVTAAVTFSHGPVLGARLEFFLDDVARTDEPRAAIALADDGLMPDEAANDLVWTGTLDPRPDRTIVRYRVLADLGEGEQVVSPRESDPYGWHAYFVSPAIATATPVYEVFIAPVNWGRMWTNITGGRVSGCNASATWDAEVPAVFAHEGRVYDVFVRYQGSRWNRTNGPDIAVWPYPRPSTGPLRALSWHVNFPRYDEMEGLPTVVLIKLTQGCPGLTSGVGLRLFEEAGVPASRTNFARLYVNGGYYRYVQQVERPGETMMRLRIAEERALDPSRPPEAVGHLFKSAGCNCDEGPYGWGDERLLPAACGWTPLQRYGYTYDPKTYNWAGAGLLQELIEAMHRARATTRVEDLRAFFQEHFDVDLMLSYTAIINWAVPFDDYFQNHFLYRRMSDGKWILMPWDLDLDFGGWQGASSSLYMGMQGDASNREGWWNYVKDSFLKAYRSEYDERMRFLNNTVLTPQNIGRILDGVLAEGSQAEADQAAAPLRNQCTFAGAAAAFRSFAQQRFTIVNQRIPAVYVDAGPDQRVFVDVEVEFDARASRPSPSDAVTYEWSNGMTGETPVYTYAEPGEYTVTLTVTAGGTAYTDSVTITVMAEPERAFSEAGGLVSMEAESFHEYLDHGAATCGWAVERLQAGASAGASMRAEHAARCTFYSNFAEKSPELRYFVDFATPGTYRVWIRAYADSSQWDSLHVGLDGTPPPSTNSQRFTVNAEEWRWSGEMQSRAPQTVVVARPGLHWISLWIRESGLLVDKVVLAADPAYVPAGEGPPESDEIDSLAPNAFVRGEVNGDKALNISDAVAMLRLLFGGAAAVCEDRLDANDDGAADLSDVMYLLAYQFTGGPAPPAPFPKRGYDTTRDQYPCGDPPE